MTSFKIQTWITNVAFLKSVSDHPDVWDYPGYVTETKDICEATTVCRSKEVNNHTHTEEKSVWYSVKCQIVTAWNASRRRRWLLLRSWMRMIIASNSTSVSMKDILPRRMRETWSVSSLSSLSSPETIGVEADSSDARLKTFHRAFICSLITECRQEKGMCWCLTCKHWMTRHFWNAASTPLLLFLLASALFHVLFAAR